MVLVDCKVCSFIWIISEGGERSAHLRQGVSGGHDFDPVVALNVIGDLLPEVITRLSEYAEEDTLILLLIGFVHDQFRERNGYDRISLFLDGQRCCSASCKALVQDRVFGKLVHSLGQETLSR